MKDGGHHSYDDDSPLAHIGHDHCTYTSSDHPIPSPVSARTAAHGPAPSSPPPASSGYSAGKYDSILKGIATWALGGNVALIFYIVRVIVVGTPDWIIVFLNMILGAAVRKILRGGGVNPKESREGEVQGEPNAVSDELYKPDEPNEYDESDESDEIGSEERNSVP